MPFQSGESGNVSGRPRGTGHRQQAFNELVEPHREALFDKAIKLALAGNEIMLRLFLERMLPAKPHSEPINLELPDDINKKAILLTMGERVLRGIANEDITPGQGKIIMDLVEEQKRLLIIQKHDREMAEILGRSPD